MRSFDVAIIGCGIIGASIALELASENMKVVIFDRQQPGREASWAAAGMLSPAPHTPRDIPLVPLARASLAAYSSFIEVVEDTSGVKTNYRRTGTLEIFADSKGDGELVRTVKEYCALGISSQAISVADARNSEPSLSSSAPAVALLPDEATVEPRLLFHAVLGAAYARGVEVRADCTVTSLLFDVSPRHKRRCVGVIANGEKILANRTIVAAGCFCGVLGQANSHTETNDQAFTADLFSRYAPLIPVLGQMLALLPRELSLQHMLRSKRGYLVPRLDGRIVAGSTIEHTDFKKGITARGMRQIIEAAIELVPDLAEAEIVETWSGLRPGTPDDLPIIGPCEIDGLFFATGHYRNGILLAPITAQIAKNWITQGRSVDDSAFSPSRFAAPTIQKRSAP